MPLQAIIDRAALRSNLQTLKAVAPHSRVMAVVKANAYGHGIVPALEALSEADGFAVARLEEAVVLAEKSLTTRPILLLEGVTDRQSLREALRWGFDLVVHHFEHLEWLTDAAETSEVIAHRAHRAHRANLVNRVNPESPLAGAHVEPRATCLNLWLKFDTGMNRLGFPARDVSWVLEQVKSLRGQWARRGVQVVARLMSHLACADEPTRPENARQEAAFAAIRAQWEREEGLIEASLCNSAALLTRPATHFQWVRPGISLYGISPFDHRSAEQLGLQPVMTLQTEVIALRELSVGESVGYGAMWRAERPSRIAILAAGYADGLPRHLPSGAPVLVAGQRVQVAGRVSMDMLAVDVTEMPQVGRGSPAVLWGQGLPIEEVAAAAGTLAYELLCALNARVPVKVL